MSEVKQEFPESAPRRLCQETMCGDPFACIVDSRVAELLSVLSEIDECMAGVEYLPKPDLKELISSAIFACGFTDASEMRYAIAAILEAIEAPYWTAHA
jgi:hypothetical protein